MNKAYMPGIHFVIFVIFSGIYIWFIRKYVVNDDLKLVASGSILLIAGVWGNVAKMTLLNLPSGPKSYRIVNYIVIVLGGIVLVVGLFKYFII